MKRLFLSMIIMFNLVAVIAVSPKPVAAAVAAGCHNSGSFFGLPPWYKYLDVGLKYGDKCAIIGPLDKRGKLDWELAAPRIGLAIIDVMLRISGVLAAAFIIYGGVQYVLSEGDAEKAKKARGTIFNSLIGLVLVLVSTAIVTLVGSTLTK